MENKDQITALAREYAEEMYPNLSEKIISLRTQEIKNAERLIHFLLRRFCLVEKEAIRKEYEMVKKIWEQVTLVDAKTFNEGRISEIESLFPEIAKEVEANNTNNKSHENSWCENEL